MCSETPNKFIQDEWTQAFCSKVRILRATRKIQVVDYFGGQVGLSHSSLSHILAGRRNYPKKHRLQAEIVLARDYGEPLGGVEVDESRNIKRPTNEELMARSEQLLMEVAFLKDKLENNEHHIRTLTITVEELRARINYFESLK
jgi:hypothetical protein